MRIFSRQVDRSDPETARIYFRALSGAVASCGVLVLVFALGALIALRASTGLLLALPGRGMESAGLADRLKNDSDAPRLKAATAGVIPPGASEEAKVLAILSWSMNQVGKVENYSAPSSWQMLEAARAGRGLICGGMAQVFHDALIANGIPARIVLFRRDIFDAYDSHVSVEAFVNGKWRLYDPTFHFYIDRNGERLSALEARASLYTNHHGEAKIINLGPTRYPARLDNYYIKFPYLIDNVFIQYLIDNVFIQSGIWLGPVRVPLAYYCWNCGVSERSNFVYSTIWVGLAFGTVLGAASATIGFVGMARFGPSHAQRAAPVPSRPGAAC